MRSGRIVEKRGWFWELLNALVVIFTFGRNRTFLTSYLTTIGAFIGVPVGWDPDRPDHRPIIAHERHHIAQQARFGLGSVWLGLVPWGLCWLLFPLPIGLAWGRYELEFWAYIAGFNAEMERMRLGGTEVPFLEARRQALIDQGVAQLTTGAYGWAWPFPKSVRARFEEHVT